MEIKGCAQMVGMIVSEKCSVASAVASAAANKEGRAQKKTN